jgi:prophage antirepressor-like protein
MSYIEFNDKKIHFIKKKGAYWIIVKSVCEALNVDYERQRKRINDDPILGSAPSNRTVQIPGDDQRKITSNICVC